MTMTHHEAAQSRREFLMRAGGGFGSLALASLLAREGLAGGAANAASRARVPHVEGKAKSVIWCFLDGGPSHIDLFDPKPTLKRLAGKPLPDSFVRPVTA